MLKNKFNFLFTFLVNLHGCYNLKFQTLNNSSTQFEPTNIESNS